MNRTGIACAVAVAALGAFVIGGAAYTGSRLEDALNTQIAQQNKALQQIMPGSKISLNSLQRGLFSSVARYDVLLDTPDDDLPAVKLTFSDHIEHGPLPMSRFGAFQWLPVMAVSHLTLEKTPDVQGWFDASGTAAPLTATTTLAYSGDLSGTLQVAPLQRQKEGLNLSISGLDAHYALTNDSAKRATVESTVKRLEISGNQGQLTLADLSVGLNSEGSDLDKVNAKARVNALDWQETDSAQPVTLRINNTELLVQRARSASNLYVGDGRLSINSLHASLPGKPSVMLSNVVFSDNMQEANQQLIGNIGYSLGAVTVADKPLGSLNVVLGYRNISALPVRKIADIFDKQSTNPTASLTPQEEQQVGDALLSILEGKPQLSIDELLVKTNNGQSRFDMQLNLQKPAEQTRATEDNIINAISAIKSTLTVNKSMIRDVVMWKALIAPETPAESLTQEADQAVEMATFLAKQSGLATIDKDSIRSALSYANNEIELNGVRMPLAKFLDNVGAGAVLRK